MTEANACSAQLDTAIGSKTYEKSQQHHKQTFSPLLRMTLRSLEGWGGK